MDVKEFYQGLSDEVKEKIKACQSLEEAKKILEDEKIELDPELLENVSGGMFWGSFFGGRKNKGKKDEKTPSLGYWIVDGKIPKDDDDDDDGC